MSIWFLSKTLDTKYFLQNSVKSLNFIRAVICWIIKFDPSWILMIHNLNSENDPDLEHGDPWPWLAALLQLLQRPLLAVLVPQAWVQLLHQCLPLLLLPNPLPLLGLLHPSLRFLVCLCLLCFTFQFTSSFILENHSSNTSMLIQYFCYMYMFYLDSTT